MIHSPPTFCCLVSPIFPPVVMVTLSYAESEYSQRKEAFVTHNPFHLLPFLTPSSPLQPSPHLSYIFCSISSAKYDPSLSHDGSRESSRVVQDGSVWLSPLFRLGTLFVRVDPLASLSIGKPETII